MIDPYRTLGLAPGAPVAEIKRAYRRLAKEHHPDSGGPAALPRFLAIQAAYEMLMRGRLSPAVGGHGAGQPPGPASRADPARAGATREGWRRQARGRPAGETGGSADNATGRRGGAREGGRRPSSSRGDNDAGNGRPGSTETDGAAKDSAAAKDGAAARDGGGTAGRRGSGGAANAPRDPAGDPAGGHAGGTRGRRRGGHDRRRATPGSTSYDEAVHEPFEPDWSGGSWYGQSSGTYWTINPREYADPRKHGPEYLARARRAAQAEGGPGDAEATAAAADMPGMAGDRARDTAADPAGGSAGDQAEGRGAKSWTEARPGGWTWSERMQRDGPSVAGGRADTRARAAGGARRFGGAQEFAASDAGSRAGARAGSSAPGEVGGDAAWAAGLRPSNGQGGGTGVFRRDIRARDDDAGLIGLGDVIERIRHQPASPRVRLMLALAGWPPIGLAFAMAIGELTGCARFAAACSSTSAFSESVLLTQVGIVAALFLIPPLARIAAFGSLAIVLAALPIVAFLTAVGASFDPEPGARALLTLLAVAWIIGIAVGLPRRSRTMAP